MGASICEVCSSGYQASYGKQRTCGRACGQELRRLNCVPQAVRKVEVRPTAHERGRHVFCVPEACEVAAELDRKQREPKCPTCGGRTTGPRRNCSGCTSASRLERKRRERRRRRNLRHGAASEPYTLADIAVRDRLRCGLCRKRVAMRQRVPHPKAPTIDHVVPLADGGDDVRANVQLAHFACNVRKRAGGTQQLALVG